MPADGRCAGVSADVMAIAEGRCGGSLGDQVLELPMFPRGMMSGRLPSVEVDCPVLMGAGARVSRVRARLMAVSIERGW